MTFVTMWCLNTPPKRLLSHVQYPVMNVKYEILKDGTVLRNGRRSYFTVYEKKKGEWIAVPDGDASIQIPIHVSEKKSWSVYKLFF